MKLMNYNQSSIASSISQALNDLRYQDIYSLVNTFIQSNLVRPLVWTVVSLLAAKDDLQLLISQSLSTLTDSQFYIGFFNVSKAYIDDHPWQTTFFVIIIIIGIILLCNPLVMIGFGVLGPIAGTLAAVWQSTVWGGAVAAGSLFAILQSCGMLYHIWIPVIGAIIIGGSIIAIAALVWGGAD